jgi:hypothetical protein
VPCRRRPPTTGPDVTPQHLQRLAHLADARRPIDQRSGRPSSCGDRRRRLRLAPVARDNQEPAAGSVRRQSPSSRSGAQAGGTQLQTTSSKAKPCRSMHTPESSFWSARSCDPAPRHAPRRAPFRLSCGPQHGSPACAVAIARGVRLACLVVLGCCANEAVLGPGQHVGQLWAVAGDHLVYRLVQTTARGGHGDAGSRASSLTPVPSLNQRYPYGLHERRRGPLRGPGVVGLAVLAGQEPTSPDEAEPALVRGQRRPSRRFYARGRASRPGAGRRASRRPRCLDDLPLSMVRPPWKAARRLHPMGIGPASLGRGSCASGVTMVRWRRR